MFIDMNSFFPSCEQQVNYYLRGRPVAVCVYPGKRGAIIAASIEAKKRGIRGPMRLDEAMAICPDLVPLETHPERYREFHIKIMKVLKRYSENVIPKSIDEAIIDITSYRLVYKDPRELAMKIKSDIRNEVGDYLKCSIGIAPNAFLAKLGTELQKPDGLVVIDRKNIDEILGKLKLTDLPGIASGTADRLIKAGITTPLQLRHTAPDKLRYALNSIVGHYWHYRLNFGEVDQYNRDYRSMQAMRQVSQEQRRSVETLQQLLNGLCMKLEQRMVRQEVYCRDIHVNIRYQNNKEWRDQIKSDKPIQDGMEVLGLIKSRMKKFEKTHSSEGVINSHITSINVTVTNFIHAELINLNLFEDTLRQNNLRKTVYDIKSRFGKNVLLKGSEVSEEQVLKDVIGFGSIKDFYVDDEINDDF